MESTKPTENLAENGNKSKPLLYDGLPPTELIALKEYYDKMFKNVNGCRSQKQVDAMKISNRIEEVLNRISETII
jgi:chromosome condensin MukBEF MukE localization factor